MTSAIFGSSVAAGRSIRGFRDPHGEVIVDDGRVLRILTADGTAEWDAFRASPAYSRLEDRIIPTRVLPRRDWPQGVAVPTNGVVLEHQRVPVFTYASEWPFSTLKRAALLHLELVKALTVENLTLKDARPSNVQPVAGGFRLTDTSSIVRRPPGSIWLGLGQFCQTMLFPLLLDSLIGLPFQPWLRGRTEGFDVHLTRRLLGWKALQPRLFSVVFLQSVLGRLTDRMGMAGVTPPNAIGIDTRKLLALFDRLAALVDGLRPNSCPTAWRDYEGMLPYSEAETASKREAVAALWGGLPRQRVLVDIGANAGTYTTIAARYADVVVGIDEDASVVDQLARAAPENVLALVADVADPPPAQGWRSRERQSLLDRVSADAAMALAVIHHLCFRGGVPLVEVVDFLTSIAPISLIEFIDPEDESVRHLAAQYGVVRPDYTRQTFLDAVARRGRILGERKVSATRHMFLIGKNC